MNNVSCYNILKMYKGDQDGIEIDLETCTGGCIGMW